MTVVPAAASGARLDRFLADRMPEASRVRIRRWIEAGHVQVNGLVADRGSVHLEAGDVVDVDAPPESPAATLAPAPEIALTILYADDDVIVVDKPAGLVVHPALGHPGGTLVNALVARFTDLALAFDDQRPGIVHRLDRETSGVIVVARTPAAAAALIDQFKARSVEKVYLALVKGVMTPAEGVIDAPIGRDPVHRQRLAVAPDGRPAQTRYRVLETLGEYTWLEARPFTGRTHQIRVHFAAMGHPVAGDTVYGRRDPAFARQALHAWRLAFDHPATGARMAFTAPVPDDLRAGLDAVGVRWETVGTQPPLTGE